MITSHLYILCGWPGSEHDVSIASGENVFLAANDPYSQVHFAVLETDGRWMLDGKVLDQSDLLGSIARNSGVVFPLIHGTFGEDGVLAGLMEQRWITFVGSGSDALKLTIDKRKTWEFLSKQGIRVPHSLSVAQVEAIESAPIEYPCIVKPRNEWSSISLYRPENKQELRLILEKELSVRQEMLVQEQIVGREFTCGVVEMKGRTIALPPSEIILTQGDTFDYRAKYTVGWCVEVTPAEIPADLRIRIQNLAKRVHELCGCRDMSRTDMILSSSGELVVLEINTIPGMTKTSFIPAQLQAFGLSLSDLVDSFLEKYSVTWN